MDHQLESRSPWGAPWRGSARNMVKGAVTSSATGVAGAVRQGENAVLEVAQKYYS